MKTRLVLLILPLLACDPSGPEDLSGNWTYSVTDLFGVSNGEQVTCLISGVSLTLDQNRKTLSGMTSGGAMACNRTHPFSLRSFTVSGSFDDGRVSFDFDSDDISHTGTLESGVIEGLVFYKGPTYNLAGTFRARR